jgi:hypothetical protein
MFPDRLPLDANVRTSTEGLEGAEAEFTRRRTNGVHAFASDALERMRSPDVGIVFPGADLDWPSERGEARSARAALPSNDGAQWGSRHWGRGARRAETDPKQPTI